MQGDSAPNNMPQPGQQISAGGSPPAPVTTDPAPVATVEPSPNPEQTPPTMPVAPQPEQTVPATDPAPTNAPVPTAPVDEPGVVSWAASEYIHEQKQATWYIGLTIVTIVLSTILYLLLHDFFGPGMIVLIAIALWMYGARKPDVLDYRIDNSGITLGKKRYAYTDFRSFSIVQDGAIVSLQLNPMKRFMPAISLFISPEQVDEIGIILGDYLPHEDKEPDAVDVVARFLRF